MYVGGHEGSVVGHVFGRGWELGISLDHFVDRIEEIFFCSHLKKSIEDYVKWDKNGDAIWDLINIL